MRNEESPSLSFSMKEAIWLNRGKRMDELLSLSLEPDISIDENDNDVTVKGVLQLYGEYRPAEDEVEEDHTNSPESLLNRVSFRTVEEVSLSNEGVGEIFHKFPLDVTIPKDRIDCMEDVYVHIDAFDYRMPQSGYLEITADLAITGLRSEAEWASAEQHANNQETVAETSVDRSFQFEQLNRDTNKEIKPIVHEPPSQEPTNQDYEENDYEFGYNDEPEFVPEVEEEVLLDDVEKMPHEPKINFHPSVEKDLNAQVERAPEVEEENNHGEIDDSVYEENQDDSRINNEHDIQTEFDQTTESDEHDEPDDEPEIKAETEVVNEEIDDERLQVNLATHSEDDREEEEIVDEPEDVEEDVGRDDEMTIENENALYLTKMLTVGEEESYSKLRMCIVQQGETLSEIANRYNIQSSQLMRMNRLKDEQISDGEILYVPVRQSPSSS